MKMNALHNDTARVIEFIKSIMQADGRTIIGIAGPPASGKSTLSEAIVEELNRNNNSSIPRAALLPMDGFHLDNAILEIKGLSTRKGAPETFNAEGFCRAVETLKEAGEETYYPMFDRQRDLAIANAIMIHPETPTVIVEGNYLLLQTNPWCRLHNLFSATVFLSSPVDLLQHRLQQRWIDQGLDPEAALMRAKTNDIPNAELIIQQSHDADLILGQG